MPTIVLLFALAAMAAADPVLGAPPPEPAPTCIALGFPQVEGVAGNAIDVATGLRELMTSYLAGPTIKIVALDARLATQARAEAKNKGCEPVLMLSLRRKSNGGRMTRALGQAAGAGAWYLPGGGTVASAAARAAAAGGLQAASSLAASTKAHDELRLEYRLESSGGDVRFGPKSDTQKASTDGEDLLTPLVARAAEAIAAQASTARP